MVGTKGWYRVYGLRFYKGPWVPPVAHKNQLSVGASILPSSSSNYVTKVLYLVMNLNTVFSIFRHDGAGLLVVDSGPAITTQSVESPRSRSVSPGLYVGGMPDILAGTGELYVSGVQGCVADLVLNDDYHLQLAAASSLGRGVGECEV